jgi:hypothetical protein
LTAAAGSTFARPTLAASSAARHRARSVCSQPNAAGGRAPCGCARPCHGVRHPALEGVTTGHASDPGAGAIPAVLSWLASVSGPPRAMCILIVGRGGLRAGPDPMWARRCGDVQGSRRSRAGSLRDWIGEAPAGTFPRRVMTRSGAVPRSTAVGGRSGREGWRSNERRRAAERTARGYSARSGSARDSSRRSHARATAQSRLTVLGDTPSTSAASSTVMPPK